MITPAAAAAAAAAAAVYKLPHFGSFPVRGIAILKDTNLLWLNRAFVQTVCRFSVVHYALSHPRLTLPHNHHVCISQYKRLLSYLEALHNTIKTNANSIAVG